MHLDCVVVKKDGFYGRYSRYNKKKKKHQTCTKKFKQEEAVGALRFGVEIDDDVVFLDIIKAVHENELLEVFIGLYNRCNALAHNKFIIENPSSDPPWDSEPETVFDHLEIYWYGQIWGKKCGNDIDGGTGCHAIGPELKEFPGEPGNYGIDMTPANRLAYLPVKINTATELYIMAEDVETDGMTIKFDKGGKHCINGEYSISFLDFLDALYEEISFFGGPEVDRGEILGGIVAEKDKIMEQIEDGKALPVAEGEYKVYMGDQVREVLGMPSNEEDRDEQIRKSADDISAD